MPSSSAAVLTDASSNLRIFVYLSRGFPAGRTDWPGFQTRADIVEPGAASFAARRRTDARLALTLKILRPPVSLRAVARARAAIGALPTTGDLRPPARVGWLRRVQRLQDRSRMPFLPRPSGQFPCDFSASSDGQLQPGDLKRVRGGMGLVHDHVRERHIAADLGWRALWCEGHLGAVHLASDLRRVE